MIKWQVVERLEQLDDIQSDSFNSTQAIFKHSTTCPISHMAKSRLENAWNIEGVAPYYLDLKSYREISNAIAEKWNVQHESPQIIIIRGGKAVFDESHLDISVEAIAGSLT